MNFVDVINAIHREKPNVQDRQVLNGDDYMRIHDWQVNGKDAQGVLLRLRVQNNATIARLDIDDMKDLQLGPGEVLTEFFCFRYYAEFDILVVHRNRDAGSYRRLEAYLMELRPDCKPATFSPVGAPNAWERMEALQSIGIAEVTIARPESLAPFANSGRSARQMADLTHESGAEYLTLRFSMGHTRRSLTDKMKGILREASGLGVIRSASVQGKARYPVGPGLPEVDETTFIDLIDDELRERVVVDIPDGRMTIGDIQGALSDAYRRRYNNLYAQFYLPDK